MGKWEHIVSVVNDLDFEKHLNNYGEYGYELVQVEPIKDTTTYFVFMKRQKNWSTTPHESVGGFLIYKCNKYPRVYLFYEYYCGVNVLFRVGSFESKRDVFWFPIINNQPFQIQELK